MNKKSVFCISIIIAATLVATEKLNKESFIAKPKQKKESRTAILESTAQLIMNNAKINPKNIEMSAQHGQIILEHGTLLLSQEKNSFFNTAEPNALQEFRSLHQEYNQLQQKIYSMQKSCDKIIAQSCAMLNKTISAPA